MSTDSTWRTCPGVVEGVDSSAGSAAARRLATRASVMARAASRSAVSASAYSLQDPDELARQVERAGRDQVPVRVERLERVAALLDVGHGGDGPVRDRGHELAVEVHVERDTGTVLDRDRPERGV